MISVVIPAYQAAATLPRQLDALTRQDYDGQWEVVVADNGSTDGTVAVARQWGGALPSLRVVDASARRGAAAARNIGAMASSGDVLAFTDADDVVMDGWLAAIATVTDSGAAFATGPPIRSAQPHTPVEVGSGPVRAPVHMRFLPYAVGTSFVVRRDVFEAAGGFDETFRTGQDVELSWRLQLDGTPLVFDARLAVDVRARGSSRATIRQCYGYGLTDPVLYERFRSRGLPRFDALQALRSYAGIVLRLPLLWDSGVRARWCRQFGRRAGRLVGSIRTRTLYL